MPMLPMLLVNAENHEQRSERKDLGMAIFRGARAKRRAEHTLIAEHIDTDTRRHRYRARTHTSTRMERR